MIFKRKKVTSSSPLAKFVRQASSGEKTKVYKDVLQRAAQSQRDVIDRALKREQADCAT